MADSAAEYFDASDDVLCGSSSELSDESGLSDGSTTNSEPEEGHGKCPLVVSIANEILTFTRNFSLWKINMESKLMALKRPCIAHLLFVQASATRKYRVSISKTPNSVVPKSTGKRTKLPAVCPDNSHVGLMAILYNNIGKKPAALFCV